MVGAIMASLVGAFLLGRRHDPLLLSRAGDGIRTHDVLLGRQELYH
jgi:hypothetical protein